MILTLWNYSTGILKFLFALNLLCNENIAFSSGLYWIDPNAGSPVDAIEVHCDLRTHTTCVLPKPSQVRYAAAYYEELDCQPILWIGIINTFYGVIICLLGHAD